jgi:hypothetical protein
MLKPCRNFIAFCNCFRFRRAKSTILPSNSSIAIVDLSFCLAEKEYKSAIRDLENALDLEGNNEVIKKELRRIKQELDITKKKEKRAFQGMFNQKQSLHLSKDQNQDLGFEISKNKSTLPELEQIQK